MNTPESSPRQRQSSCGSPEAPGTRVPNSEKVAGSKEGGDTGDEAEAVGRGMGRGGPPGAPVTEFRRQNPAHPDHR